MVAHLAPRSHIFKCGNHWTGDHDILFPKLISNLMRGGVLAIQMPNNWNEPSHKIMKDLATKMPFKEILQYLIHKNPVQKKDAYIQMLKPFTSRLDIWETTYSHTLKGPDPIYNWIKATNLGPLLKALKGQELESFKDIIKREYKLAYPQIKGETKFPFKGLFIIATVP